MYKDSVFFLILGNFAPLQIFIKFVQFVVKYEREARDLFSVFLFLFNFYLRRI